MTQQYITPIASFEVNLSENRILSSHLPKSMVSRYQSRLDENNDYRQFMLSYFINDGDNEEKDMIIQRLLPDRLISQLNTKRHLTIPFHTTNRGMRLAYRMEIQKESANDTSITFNVFTDYKHSTIQNYRIGSNCILLIKPDDHKGTSNLISLLQSDYNIIRAHSIEKAQKILEERYFDVTLIITDYEADCIDDLRFLKRVKRDIRFQTIPYMLICSNYSDLLIKNGASEVITRPFQESVLMKRIQNLMLLRDSYTLLNNLEKDDFTGYYSREFFFMHATGILTKNPNKSYNLLNYNIENYEMHLEKYGPGVVNMIVTHLVEHIKKDIPDVVLCGRFDDDEFLILREAKPVPEHSKLRELFKQGSPIPNLEVKVGFVHAVPNTTIQTLYEQTKTALLNIRQVYGVNVAEYNDAMHKEMQKEQKILSSMESSLEQKHFKVYYQPKHITQTGALGGAEALVRWEHPEYGLISPSTFIPIFERVGFIRGLDRYIFVQVCKDILKWQALQLPVVPVSINLSRRDFDSPELAEWIINTTDSMHINHDLIHLEVTESAFSENPEMIANCIHKLHEAGFKIELDDFGAGYSSLNTLNSLDLDILKIDRSIVAQDLPGSKRNVLDFCMQLAKMLDLKTVAEGVETRSQIVRMQNIGCDYIQGFFYSQPLTREAFEKYMQETL